MVRRHQACIVPLVLLALGLRPSTGRLLPRFGLGSSSSPGGLAERASGSSASQRTVLRLGGGRHSCLVSAGEGTRRGAWGLPVARELRGGAIPGADSSEEDEGDRSSLDDDDDFDDDEEDMTEEQDFGEASFVDRFKQDWRKTPIITKTFFQVSVGIAVVAFLLNDNQWPNFLLLDWQPAIFKLQLWRLFTPFLYLGPVGMNFALTVHFAWTYMSQLEKLHYREPHTFVMLLAFGMSCLLLLTLVTGADVNSSFTLGHSLSCFLVMVWSRKFAGTRVNVLDMFELSTELLPYFFVLQTLMMEGVVPWVDLSGLLIGYAWETLSIKGLLKAPKPLVNLFRKNAFLRAEYAKAGKEYGQDLPLHDDDEDEDEDEEDRAPVPPKPTPEEEESEEPVEGSEEEAEGGAVGKPAAAAAERESQRGDRPREGGLATPPGGAARAVAGGGRGEDDAKAAEPEPSSEENGTEEDAYYSSSGEEEEEEEASDSAGGGETEEEEEESAEREERSEEEGEEELSEESDELEEDFEGEESSEGDELDLDVEELFSGSFEESGEDGDSSSDF